jgi:peptidoglycan hydrolase-like protein with peptidoglycan-binding domain
MILWSASSLGKRVSLLGVLAVSVWLLTGTPANGQAATAPATSTAAAKKTIQGAQERLLALGYQPGAADGVMGAKAIAALKKFQSDHSLPVTGQLDRKTLDALNATAMSAKKSGLLGAKDSQPEGKIDVGAEEDDWNKAQLKGDADSYREFSRRHPNSPNVQIVDITIGARFTFFQWPSWLQRDRDEAREFTSESNGSWGYAVDSVGISIYPLSIPRASTLGLRATEVLRDSGGKVVGATPPSTPMRAKVLCVKDGPQYWIVGVEEKE